MIHKTKEGYKLKSKLTGRNLGEYRTLKDALKREKQVQYFKNKKGM